MYDYQFLISHYNLIVIGVTYYWKANFLSFQRTVIVSVLLNRFCIIALKSLLLPNSLILEEVKSFITDLKLSFFKKTNIN